MTEDYIELKEMATIIEVNDGTLRVYLSRYEFSKNLAHRLIGNNNKTVCLLNDNFVKNFSDFLVNKNKKESAKLLKQYWQKYNKIKNNQIEQTLDLTSKHYESLLERYREAIAINKELQKAYQKIMKICQEQADSIAVLDLQNRIKEILNE